MLFQTRESPEFWPVNKSPFYSLQTGERSCYSHVVMAGGEAFIRAGGEPDLRVYTEVIRERFGEGTAWQEALRRRKESYSPDVRMKWREPVPGPWLHGAIIHLLGNKLTPLTSHTSHFTPLSHTSHLSHLSPLNSHLSPLQSKARLILTTLRWTRSC